MGEYFMTNLEENELLKKFFAKNDDSKDKDTSISKLN